MSRDRRRPSLGGGGQSGERQRAMRKLPWAGRAHVEATKAGGAGKGNIVRKPSAELCERCHNAKSPHFRGFFYDAMLGFAHRTKGRA